MFSVPDATAQSILRELHRETSISSTPITDTSVRYLGHATQCPLGMEGLLHTDLQLFIMSTDQYIPRS